MTTTTSRRVASFGVALVAALALAYGSYAYSEGLVPFGPRDDQWSGVFLTNGQAYFGHFYAGPGEYGRLREVYYVLATQLQSQDPNVPPQTQLSVQRLGGEIHGPTQDMKISKQQILFVEELRPDSTLVRAIAQLRTQPLQQPPLQPQATQPPAAPAPTPTPARTASPSPARTP